MDGLASGFLYQWHKFPFHAVDWAIGIGLLHLISITILDFTKKQSLLSVGLCTLEGKIIRFVHPSLLLLSALHGQHPREVLRERVVCHRRLERGLGRQAGRLHGRRRARHERLKVAANCLLQLAQ